MEKQGGMQNMLEFPDPLVGRYLNSEGMLPLASEVLSEGALYLRYALLVEVALLEVLAEDGWFDAGLLPAARQAAEEVTLDEFQQEESRVRHDLKALVNVYAARCPEGIRSYIHLGATSYDILANAHLLRLRAGVERVLLPELDRCLQELHRLGLRYAGTAQVGRTHGQYAEPMTFGYSMAVYLERLGWCRLELKKSLDNLRGKFSGAVGAYTTPGLLHANARDVEERVLAKVGLKAAEAYLESSQVGSSAMPHKRNPITWENVKSLWKTFMPQMMTFYLDQVSEHQRDLSNSASARFLPRLILGLALAGRRTAKGLTSLVVDEKTMVGRLSELNEVVSGPLQALLSGLGLEDAHEYVRVASVEARKQGKGLLEVAELNAELKPWIDQLKPEQRKALSKPELLCGPAEVACLRALSAWAEKLELPQA